MAKVKGIRETVNRIRRGQIDVYEWPVRHIEGNTYYCPDLDFRFDAETGQTTKGVKIGKTFKSGPREITYELIIEE
jgi:hypothetical protein